MTTPKSYEALAADLASEKIISKTLQGQKEDFMSLADKRKADLDAALAREDALREDRDQYQRIYNRASIGLCAIGEVVGVPEEDQSTSAVIDALTALMAECDALQQRLTDAEKFVQKMLDCTKGKDSIATGYLSDILALLKQAAEGEGS